MKSTETFKKSIQDHLNEVAENDSLFAETLKKETKNIDDCITHIFNQVKASGCNGFADEEIYGMAVHYYDEDDIKPGNKITNGSVIVNHKVELSDNEIEEARRDAKEKVIAEEKERLRKKPSKKKVEAVKVEPNLFDSL